MATIFRLLWLLAVILCTAGDRDIHFKDCIKKLSVSSNNCKVRTVTVGGCLEPTTWVDVDGSITEYRSPLTPKAPCRFGPGSVLNVTIQYDTGFDADSLGWQLSLPLLEDCWQDSEGRCPLPRIAADACLLTKCPVRAGHERTFHTSLPTDYTLPRRTYNDRKVYQMKWKLWESKNKDNHCCITFLVQY